MQVVPATTAKHFDAIYDLYLTAFPENERKSFSMMRQLITEGSVEMIVFSAPTRPFSGFAIMAVSGEVVLVDYLAIHPDCRGRGFGSKALQWLMNHYRDKKLCLEIESTFVEADNMPEREGRKRFYLNNHLKLLPFEAIVFGVQFELLANDLTINADDFVGVYHQVYGLRYAQNVKIQNKQKR